MNGCPRHVPADDVLSYDFHFGETELRNPVASLDAVRPERRAFFSDKWGGFWVFTRYEDMRKIAQNPEMFSNQPIGIPPQGYAQRPLIPSELDPPTHTKYRHLLSPYFAPGQIRSHEPKIREVARGLIDGMLETTSCEFIAAFARPLPTRVFLSLVDFPQSEADRFVSWTHDVMHKRRPEDERERNEARRNITEFLLEVMQARRAAPGDDLVSYLQDGLIDGERISEEALFDTLFQVFLAGLDTVTNTMGFLIQFLATHAAQRQALLDDPALLPNALEELLRLHSIVSMTRRVTCDIEFEGYPLRTGDMVLLPTWSAGRDEAAFDHPLEADFKRESVRHLAFGAGPHRCLGSHLARLEMTVALEELLARMPDIHLDPVGEVKYHGGVLGVDELPIRYSRAEMAV
jgi:cytochrome P450